MDLSVEGKSERIPPGSHICQLYSKVTEIPGVTARLMRVGLSVSEKCLFAAAPPQVKELRGELQKLQVDVDALLEALRSLFFALISSDVYRSSVA
ncbi:MAG: hypothetical protein E6J34_06145 [Chloroflexi bacterium]|nr:MAG: hypothetical protein E6J34_06145 [Chloroflexota bacterium]